MVFYGAVHSQVIAIVGIAFSGLAIACCFQQLRPGLRSPVNWAMSVTALMLTWILLQGTSLFGLHPAWGEASEILGPLSGAVSVAPHQGFMALPVLLIPFMAFICGVVIFQTDAAAKLLLQAIAAISLAAAILGIYEYAFAPGQLLFQPRVHHMDGVTGTFVNRNTAATFFGMGSIVWGAILLDQARRQRIWRRMMEHRMPRDADMRAIMRLSAVFVGFLALLIALFLTKSRAGILSSLAGMMMTFAVMSIRFSAGASLRRRLLQAVGSTSLILSATGLYGVQFLDRVRSSDLETEQRWCFLSDILSAIRDNPMTGLGFGTFEAAYPSYRSISCMTPDMTLDRAHNGYAEITMGLGVLVLIPIVASIAYLLWTYVAGIRNRRRMMFAPAVAMGSLVLVVLHSFLDFSLQIMGVAIFAAAILAAGTVSSHRSPRGRHRRHAASETPRT